jgi:hypothetical protein
VMARPWGVGFRPRHPSFRLLLVRRLSGTAAHQSPSCPRRGPPPEPTRSRR